MLQKQRRLSGTLLGIIVGLAAISPAFAGSPEFDRGMKAFKAKQFSAAAKDLGTAVQRQDKYNAWAYYYLGTALLSLRKTDEALGAFRKAYSLDPKGQAGKYATATLRRFGKDAFKEPACCTTEGAKNSAKNDPTCCADGKVMEAKAAVPQINIDKTGLPAVPSFERGPYVSMVKRWDFMAQSDFVKSGESAQLNEKAKTNLVEAQKTLNQAESFLRIYIPTKRKATETPAQFQVRYEAASKQVDDVLAPYKKAVADQQQAVKDAAEIERICSDSRRAAASRE